MTTKTETNRTKTNTTMRKYSWKSDGSSRPLRTNIAFPRVFCGKTEKPGKKKEAEEEEDDEEAGKTATKTTQHTPREPNRTKHIG